MRAEYINPFVTSLKSTFQTMLECEAHRTELSVKKDNRARYDVSGVIGLTGKAVGTVVLTLSEQVALKAASTMLANEATTIDEEVLDAVGELTNMVAGGAKSQLEELQMSASLPSVVTGRDHEIHFPSDVTPLSIAFDTKWGPLAIEVALVSQEERAASRR